MDPTTCSRLDNACARDLHVNNLAYPEVPLI